jgi:hypothetical protein
MLATLLQTIAKADPSYAARRVRRAIIDYVIAGICLTIGAGFVLVGLFIIAAERYGAVATSFGFGVGFIVLAIVALTVHRIVARISARRRAQEARAAQIGTFVSTAAIALLPALLRSRSGVLPLLAPLAAFAAYAIYKENSGDTDDTEDL